MSQFGGATTIGPDVRLILLDCFETMVELDGTTYRPRLGMTDFLTHFGARVGVPLAVTGDAKRGEGAGGLARARMAPFLLAVSHVGNAAEEPGSGRMRKRLDVP